MSEGWSRSRKESESRVVSLTYIVYRETEAGRQFEVTEFIQSIHLKSE